MTDAPTAADAVAPPGPQDRPASRSAGLIALVRVLIGIGRELIGSLQRQNRPDAPADVAWRFGTIDLALIIARITRGLRMAEALEERVIRGAKRLDTPPVQTAVTRPPDRPRATRRTPSPLPDDDAALRNLPSAREIAEQIRHRPIGDVLIDICRDLGIDGTHPLWRQLYRAILLNNGNLARMLRGLSQRLRAPAVPLPDTFPPLPDVWLPVWARTQAAVPRPP